VRCQCRTVGELEPVSARAGAIRNGESSQYRSRRSTPADELPESRITRAVLERFPLMEVIDDSYSFDVPGRYHPVVP
jgi:hypothetical protein